MNTLESYAIINPLGKPDTCSKFVIDEINIPFVLHDIMVANQEYTLSFWVRADAESTLNVSNATIHVTTEWVRHYVTFYTWDVNVGFAFSTVGTYYIYHPKLEVGNKSTDWTAAPEDTDDAIVAKGEELSQAIVDQAESTINDANAYVDDKLTNYANKEEVRKIASDAALEVDSELGEVRITVSSVVETLTETNDTLNRTVTDLKNHFDFTTDGLKIFVNDNPFKTVIKNDRYSMTMNDEEVLYFDGHGKGHIPDLTVDRAFNLLGLRFEKDANGNLNATYTGGE